MRALLSVVLVCFLVVLPTQCSRLSRNLQDFRHYHPAKFSRQERVDQLRSHPLIDSTQHVPHVDPSTGQPTFFFTHKKSWEDGDLLPQLADVFGVSAQDATETLEVTAMHRLGKVTVAEVSRKINGMTVLGDELRVLLNQQHEVVSCSGTLSPVQTEFTEEEIESVFVDDIGAVQTCFAPFRPEVLVAHNLKVHTQENDQTILTLPDNKRLHKDIELDGPITTQKAVLPVNGKAKPVYIVKAAFTYKSEGASVPHAYTFIVDALDNQLYLRSNDHAKHFGASVDEKQLGANPKVTADELAKRNTQGKKREMQAEEHESYSSSSGSSNYDEPPFPHELVFHVPTDSFGTPRPVTQFQVQLRDGPSESISNANPYPIETMPRETVVKEDWLHGRRSLTNALVDVTVTYDFRPEATANPIDGDGMRLRIEFPGKYNLSAPASSAARELHRSFQEGAASNVFYVFNWFANWVGFEPEDPYADAKLRASVASSRQLLTPNGAWRRRPIGHSEVSEVRFGPNSFMSIAANIMSGDDTYNAWGAMWRFQDKTQPVEKFTFEHDLDITGEVVTFPGGTGCEEVQFETDEDDNEEPIIPDAWANLEGKIVKVSRGGCSLEEKMSNAFRYANALALVVVDYTDADRPTDLQAYGDFTEVIVATATFPPRAFEETVFVSSETGAALTDGSTITLKGPAIMRQDAMDTQSVTMVIAEYIASVVGGNSIALNNGAHSSATQEGWGIFMSALVTAANEDVDESDVIFNAFPFRSWTFGNRKSGQLFYPMSANDDINPVTLASVLTPEARADWTINDWSQEHRGSSELDSNRLAQTFASALWQALGDTVSLDFGKEAMIDTFRNIFLTSNYLSRPNLNMLEARDTIYAALEALGRRDLVKFVRSAFVKRGFGSGAELSATFADEFSGRADFEGEEPSAALVVVWGEPASRIVGDCDNDDICDVGEGIEWCVPFTFVGAGFSEAYRPNELIVVQELFTDNTVGRLGQPHVSYDREANWGLVTVQVRLDGLEEDAEDYSIGVDVNLAAPSWNDFQTAVGAFIQPSIDGPLRLSRETLHSDRVNSADSPVVWDINEGFPYNWKWTEASLQHWQWGIPGSDYVARRDHPVAGRSIAYPVPPFDFRAMLSLRTTGTRPFRTGPSQSGAGLMVAYGVDSFAVDQAITTGWATVPAEGKFGFSFLMFAEEDTGDFGVGLEAQSRARANLEIQIGGSEWIDVETLVGNALNYNSGSPQTANGWIPANFDDPIEVNVEMGYEEEREDGTSVQQPSGRCLRGEMVRFRWRIRTTGSGNLETRFVFIRMQSWGFGNDLFPRIAPQPRLLNKCLIPTPEPTPPTPEPPTLPTPIIEPPTLPTPPVIEPPTPIQPPTPIRPPTPDHDDTMEMHTCKKDKGESFTLNVNNHVQACGCSKGCPRDDYD